MGGHHPRGAVFTAFLDKAAVWFLIRPGLSGQKMPLSFEEITAGLQKIISLPVPKFREGVVPQMEQDYAAKHPTSKTLFAEAVDVIPGGYEHNLAFSYPFPLVIDRAQGPYMWDVDENQYLDYLMVGAPIILGHNYEPLREKVVELIQTKGPSHGVTSIWEIRLAQEIRRHFPSCELVRMFQSGTEADMAAARLARTNTGKKKIIKCGGSYHGWSDQLVYSLHVPQTKRLESEGIPMDVLKHTLDFDPNDIDGLRKEFEKNESKGGIAAVYLEPLGGESGTRPTRPGFNKEVRELCDQYGALLIYDEVVTAFRYNIGGAQAVDGVKPDLTVFGKIIGGGFPSAGALGGSADVMGHCAAGVESGSGKKRAYVGGTLAGNPLTCMAGYHTIKMIEETGAIQKAGRAGDLLSAGLNDLFAKHGLPFLAWNYESIGHVETSSPLSLNIMDPSAFPQLKPRKHFMEQLGAMLCNYGIFVMAGSRWYTCMAHTEAHVKQTLDVYDEILTKVTLDE
jgi:glutamate-1-semialdehyde 2,1-aminomutase